MAGIMGSASQKMGYVPRLSTRARIFGGAMTLAALSIAQATQFRFNSAAVTKLQRAQSCQPESLEAAGSGTLHM
jgi:hypothetical protein